MTAKQLIDQRWSLVTLMGEGSFGAVWLAADARFAGRKVAVKLLKPEFTAMPQVVQRFENEALALGHLHHANLVQVLDRGVWQDNHYLVMEYVEGHTLKDHLAQMAQQRQIFDIATVIAIFDQICAGVAAAHRGVAAGPVVHRDLKPSNLMLSQDPDGGFLVKILDFGIAQLGGRNATRSGAQMGTLNYMAPEQLLGETRRVSTATDVFALGVILLEMLTFHRYYDDETTWAAFVLRNEAALPSVLVPLRSDIVPALWEVIFAAMRANPEQRPFTADVLRAAVRQAVGLGPSAFQSFQGALTSPRIAPTVLTTGPLPLGNVSPSVDAFVRHDRPSAILTHPPPARVRWLPYAALALVAVFALGAREWFKHKVPDTSQLQGANAVIQPPAPTPPRTPVPIPIARCDEARLEIPAGAVTLGARVDVPAFCLDAHEVTLAQYRAFATRQGVEVPREVRWRGVTPSDHAADLHCTGGHDATREREPFNCIDWSAARAYCRAAGADLPAEAQWELALRGEDNAPYPWGRRAPATGDLNACGRECVALLRTLEGDPELNPLFDAADSFVATAPVGSFEADRNPHGVTDLAGNVREWLLDGFGSTPSESATRDPESHDYHVVRGGSWKSALPTGLDLAHRGRVRADVRDVDIGFRCASPVRTQ